MDAAVSLKEREPLRLVDLSDGRDELNLAEFPLAAIADRVATEQKTLVFEDRIRDYNSGEVVARTLTITASDKYGLPTALDDEVILGLVQLTRLTNDFRSARVYFTRYELIKLLGWREEGRSYSRIEESLNRWIGVTLYYEKAWWDREAQSWVDEKFHILEHVSLYDRESARRLKRRIGQLELPLSSFTWNHVVFRSFQAENLKRLDLRLYLRLKHAAAKRAYRFLDKRFYRRGRWEFNLREFACEHIGLSRNYHTGELKRRLLPAIEELEAEHFLEPLGEAERFVKLRRGDWKVVFVRKENATVQPALNQPPQPLEQGLVERGVTPVVASKLVQVYPEERISTKLEVFDWMLKNGDRQLSRNPAGYLVKSIHDDYSAPKGFEPRAKREERTKAAEEKRRLREEAQQRREAEEAARRQAELAPVTEFWESLSKSEQAELERRAVQEASAWLQSQAEGTGPVAQAARKRIVEGHIRKLLLAREAEH